MAVTIVQKAPRLPNGRVPGISPAQLWPNVVARLTPQQQLAWREISLKAYEIKVQNQALGKRFKAFLEGLGLDPKGAYSFRPGGEVVAVGKHRPVY